MTKAERRIEDALTQVRALLERHGVLFAHDPVLPSVTSVVAGAPVAGSWWGHPAGEAIFEVLSALEDEVAWPKLVDGKVTLVHERLWPALAAIGAAREPWQMRGAMQKLVDAADRVEREGELTAVDLGLERRETTVLERRLLALGHQRHTDTGHHERVLGPWSRLAPDEDRPPVDEARAAFEHAIAPWKGGRLPWAAPRKAPRDSKSS
jgi:hypothetical protein